MRRYYTQRHPILVIGPSIAYIPLTRGLFALIDSDDMDSLGAFTWHARVSSNGDKIYAIRRMRKHENVSCDHVFMHKLLCASKIADHINGNELDNRRANLRPATTQQNNRNRRIGNGNTSGFKGVSWNKGKWQAQLKVSGKHIQLGRFATASEAGKAYEMFAKKIFGEFARTE